MLESLSLFGWLWENWGQLGPASIAAVVLLISYPVLNAIVEMTPTQIDNIALKFIVDKVARPMVQSKRTRAALSAGPPVEPGPDPAVVSAVADRSRKQKRNRNRHSDRPRAPGDGDGMGSGDA